MNTLIRNATILTMDGQDSILPGCAIAVEGGRIAYAGPEQGLPAGFAAGKVIDAGGGIAMPGFVNAHTHLAMTLLRGYGSDLNLQDWLEKKVWPAEDRLKADHCYWGSMLGLAEMIRSGTTTFLDMYFFMDETVRAVEETGMRAVLSRGLIGQSPDFARKLAENEALFRDSHGAADGRITVMLGPHAEYTCDEASMRQMAGLAQKLGCGVHVHVQETRPETDGCYDRHGVSPTQWLANQGLFEGPAVAAHCVTLSSGDIEILQRHNVSVTHCPGSNMKLASGLAPVMDMLHAGLNVAIGTDGASSNNNLDMLEETHLAALSAKMQQNNPVALGAYRALKMATRGGAVAVGIDTIAGSIEVGKDADIIVFSTNSPSMHPAIDPVANLVYSANSSNVSMTMVKGRVLMENKEIIGLDLDRINSEADKIANEICV